MYSLNWSLTSYLLICEGQPLDHRKIISYLLYLLYITTTIYTVMYTTLFFNLCWRCILLSFSSLFWHLYISGFFFFNTLGRLSIVWNASDTKTKLQQDSLFADQGHTVIYKANKWKQCITCKVHCHQLLHTWLFFLCWKSEKHFLTNKRTAIYSKLMTVISAFVLCGVATRTKLELRGY